MARKKKPTLGIIPWEREVGKAPFVKWGEWLIVTPDRLPKHTFPYSSVEAWAARWRGDVSNIVA